MSVIIETFYKQRCMFPSGICDDRSNCLILTMLLIINHVSVYYYIPKSATVVLMIDYAHVKYCPALSCSHWESKAVMLKIMP